MRYVRLSLSLVVVASFVTSLSACQEDPAVLLRKKANQLYAKDDFAGAAVVYEELLKTNPKDAETVQNWAIQSWVKAKQPGKGGAILERAAEQKQGDEKVKAYRELAGFYMDPAKDFDAAERTFMKILELKPKDKDTMGWLAEIAASRGGARLAAAVAVPEQLDKAIKWYDALSELAPNDPIPLVNKRICYFKYINYLVGEREAADTAVKTVPRGDKEALKTAKEKLEEIQAKEEKLRAELDELTKKIEAVSKAAKEAKAAAAAAAAAAKDGGAEAAK